MDEDIEQNSTPGNSTILKFLGKYDFLLWFS